ncbi:MAG: serine hydrolase [Deltaproteobacteria bacterium]|nr:serine hydrolase [Deltaproteobacteria bacterium]
MSSSKFVLLIACCSFAVHSNVVFADEATQEPTAEEILAHPEVKGALGAIDAWVEGVRTYDRIPGVSVGIVHDQDLIWSKGYGYSNVESKRPADADTLYSICSISKLFTSIAIMQLRDANKLTLRDPVGKHLDWFDIKQAYEQSGPITIESLLTHSSGLPRESDFPYWGGPDFPFPTRQQMIEKLKAQSTLYPAQRHYQYSNLAVSLAGEIVQERSGKEYQAYIKANILGPLGMSSTRTYYPEKMRGEGLAIGYTGMDRSGARESVNPFFTRGITPAAGFTSSVNDLARFASWQFRLLEDGGEEVLQANTLREMQRVHWLDDDDGWMFGLGFEIWRVGDIKVAGHGGGCPGYITNFLLSEKDRVAIVALTNAADGPAIRVAENILKTISAALKEAKTPSEDAIPEFSMYEGNYQTPPWGGELAIRQWGDQLVTISIPSDDLEKAMTKLKHDKGHTFIRLTDDDEPREPWVFEMAEDGKAERILRHSGYSKRIE